MIITREEAQKEIKKGHAYTDGRTNLVGRWDDYTNRQEAMIVVNHYYQRIDHYLIEII